MKPMRSLLHYSAALLALALPVVAQNSSSKKPETKTAINPNATATTEVSKETVEAYFKRMFGYDQNLQVRVVSIAPSAIPELTDVTVVLTTPEGQQAGHWFVSRDQQHAIAGDILPFGTDPFKHDRDILAQKSFGATKGPADSKLLIVEFADPECPSCRQAQPIIERLQNDFPTAKFVFQSFPLTQIHPWALQAVSYLDCMARDNNDRANAFVQAVFTHQGEIESDVRKTTPDGKSTLDEAALTERLNRYVSMVGGDPAKVAACSKSPETSQRITRSELLAQELGVTGTPTLFVNGRRLTNFLGVPYEALKAVIQFEQEQAGAK